MTITLPETIKVKLAIIVILLSTGTYGSAFCQDRGYFTGYVVLNGGDTLHGKIKTYEMDNDPRSFEVVKLLKDDVKLEFGPNQVVSYKVLNYYYERKEIGDKNPELVFGEIAVKGHCTLFSVAKRVRTYSSTGQAMLLNVRTNYLQRPNEKAHPVNFRLLKLGMDLYFIDNVQLTYDIRNKKYRPEQMKEIVRRYNKEWEMQSKSNVEN